MKYNIYLKEHNVDSRIIPIFKGPILQKKEILKKKYKDIDLLKPKTNLVYNIPHYFLDSYKKKKKLINYIKLITISQLKNKNLNFVNDIKYQIKINLNLNEKYINDWTKNKLNDKDKKKSNKNLLFLLLNNKNKKNKLLDPEYMQYLFSYKKLNSINIFYSPLKIILLNKYLISRILFLKNIKKLKNLKKLRKIDWNKLSKYTRIIIYLKLKILTLLKNNHITYKQIIYNYKNINNNFLKQNLIKLLKNNNLFNYNINNKYNINNYIKNLYLNKYLKLKKQKLRLNKIVNYKKVLTKMLTLVDLLIQKKKNYFLLQKIRKYWNVAYEKYKEEQIKKLKQRIELFELKNDILLFPAKDLNDIRFFKNEIEYFLKRFRDIENTNKNQINLENSYLNIIKDPVELSNNFIKNTSNRLNFNFNPLITYKQKQSNLINYNNLNNNNINNNYSNNNKLNYNKLLAENKIKMGYMVHKIINKYKKFDSEISTIDEIFPLDIYKYKTDKNPIISQYLKSMSIYNKINKGTIFKYNKIIAYKFNSKNYFIVRKINKYLNYTFKGMFSLISRPVYIFNQNKFKIRFFYFILLNKIFKKKKQFNNNKFYNYNTNTKYNKKYKKKIKFKIKHTKNIMKKNIKKEFESNIKYYKITLIKLILLYKFLIFINKILVTKNISSTSKTQLKIFFKIIKKKIKLFKIIKFNWESYLNWNFLSAKNREEYITKRNRNYRLRKIRKFNYETRKLKIKKDIFKKLGYFPIANLFKKKFKDLTDSLSKKLKNNVQLELIRLHYPYKNSNILANYLALLVNKLKFIRITRKLLKYSIIKKYNNYTLLNIDNIIPSYLTGLKIKIGGRLMKYRVVRKRTVKLFERGISSPGKVNFTDWARYTSKNRRGAFSITVSTGQNIF